MASTHTSTGQGDHGLCRLRVAFASCAWLVPHACGFRPLRMALKLACGYCRLCMDVNACLVLTPVLLLPLACDFFRLLTAFASCVWLAWLLPPAYSFCRLPMACALCVQLLPLVYGLCCLRSGYARRRLKVGAWLCWHSLRIRCPN